MVQTGDERRTRVHWLLVIAGLLILGVAASAFPLWRAKRTADRVVEAAIVLASVRAAQEAYFSRYGAYCGASEVAALWPPNQLPYQEKVEWGRPTGAWGQLGVGSPKRTWFQYSMWAGRPGQAPPAGLTIDDPSRAWFVVQAHGDPDEDGEVSGWEVSSERPEVSPSGLR